ncbi:unnamed protein product, partial [Ixodes hexagonus]
MQQGARTLRCQSDSASDAGKMVPAPSRPLIGPPISKGSPEDSVAEWLTCYDHVASLNSWDNEAKVKCLYPALDGDARKWYTTQILTGAPASWDEWKALLQRSFGSSHAAEVAHLQLQSRGQLPFESPEQYYYDVMQLCARVDPTIKEEDRLRHLLRGLRPDFVEKVVLSNPKTCADFLQTLQRLNQASMMSQGLWTTTPTVPASLAMPSVVHSLYPISSAAGVPPRGPASNTGAERSVDVGLKPYVLPSCPATAQVPQAAVPPAGPSAPHLATILTSLQTLKYRLSSIEGRLARGLCHGPQGLDEPTTDGRSACTTVKRDISPDSVMYEQTTSVEGMLTWPTHTVKRETRTA